ncbi:hypothetical protein [Brevundimonas vesicularis]|uniref:hypothetical protein n=1 Tax=Brevundimonas vesicularis TaxID=41276 RepID=UPI0038D46044
MNQPGMGGGGRGGLDQQFIQMNITITGNGCGRFTGPASGRGMDFSNRAGHRDQAVGRHLAQP